MQTKNQLNRKGGNNETYIEKPSPTLCKPAAGLDNVIGLQLVSIAFGSHDHSGSRVESALLLQRPRHPAKLFPPRKQPHPRLRKPPLRNLIHWTAC